MEFTGSARKHYAEHGITDDDAMHAIRNPLRIVRQRGEYEGRLMIIGVDSSARFLEVVVVPADEPEAIIHVNVLQPKRYHYLGGDEHGN